MRVILVATLAAGFVLAGCQTTPEDQSAAAVEDRSKPGAKPGADAKSVERPKIAAVDVTQGKKDAASALKDPASILSKRSIYYELDKYDVKDEYRGLIEAHAKYLR